MNGRIIKLAASTHQTVQELLPWFVTNTLSAEETALVQIHLQACSQCRADADRQRMLHAAQPRSGPMPDVEQAWARLRPQLDTQRPGPARPALSALWSRIFKPGTGWLRWVVVGQSVAIVVLAVLLMPPFTGSGLYRGLGAAGGPSGNIVVMFKPETTEQELRTILQESGARLIDGPTASHAYILEAPDEQQKSVLHALRSQRAVALAEPLDSGSGR